MTILRTLCSLKRRPDFIQKKKMVFNDFIHKNAQYDKNIEMFYKNDKEHSQIDENPQIIEENLINEEN